MYVVLLHSIRLVSIQSFITDKTRSDSANKEVFLNHRASHSTRLKENERNETCEHYLVEVQKMKKQQNQNKIQPKKLEETKTGYGDKKIEGPDRPST